MQIDTILSLLKSHKSEFAEKYGVTRIGVFGSFARESQKEASDVDVVVEMPPDLYKMVHMKQELEALFSKPVDLIRYQKYLDKTLKKHIDREAVYV